LGAKERHTHHTSNLQNPSFTGSGAVARAKGLVLCPVKGHEKMIYNNKIYSGHARGLARQRVDFHPRRSVCKFGSRGSANVHQINMRPLWGQFTEIDQTNEHFNPSI
jgi:hypothetical protein